MQLRLLSSSHKPVQGVDESLSRGHHNIGVGMDKVGEHLSYVNKHGKCCVALQLHLAAAQPKPKEPAKSAAFRDECSRLSVAHADKTCITIGEDEKDKGVDDVADKPTEWPDEDSSSEEEESDDDMSRPPIQGIWLPKFYDQERERVFAHIHDGAGETSSIKQRLQKGTTDTGNVKFGIVEAEWDWLQKRFKGDAAREQKYFCALLALTQAMVYDDYWMYDNECREQRARIIGTYDSLTGCFARRLGGNWRFLQEARGEVARARQEGRRRARDRAGGRRRGPHAGRVQESPCSVTQLVQDAHRGPPGHGLQVLARDAQAPRGRRHAQGEEGEEVSDPDRHTWGGIKFMNH